MCGEKHLLCAVPFVRLGSPPHVRGKGTDTWYHLSSLRITPACAGKRWEKVIYWDTDRDHPRMCGEKCCSGSSCSPSTGSPPHVRGKVCGQVRRTSYPGITPACAGKRLKRSRSTVPPVAIVPLFPSVCNKPVVSDGSPAGRDAPLFLPAENAVPASPAYNLRSL